MMKILKYCLPAVLILVSIQLKAQNPLISQYYLNSYVINPSLSGVSGNLSALAAYRQEFIGFDDAPRTQTLSFEMPFKEEKFGIGAYLSNYTVGPQRRTGFQASYAYHLRFGDDVNVSFGLGANFWNTAIDFTTLIGDDVTNNDPVFLGERTSSSTFDATAGLNFSTQNFYTGFSVINLANMATRFSDDSGPFMYNNRHYYWLTGFRIPVVDSVLNFEPSFFIKYAVGNSPQADITGRFIYKDFFWVAASYRAKSTVVGAVGLRVKDMIDVGYSYDAHLSPLTYFGGPAHEITIKYTLDLNPPPVEIKDSIPPDIYAVDTVDTVDSVIADVIDSTTNDSDIAVTPVTDEPNVDEEYNEKISEGDAAFANRDWDAAEKAYKDAQALKPEETYPPDRLSAIAAARANEKDDSLATAEKARQDSIAAEKARQDSVAAERAKQDSIAAEKARQDSMARADKARRDSIAAAKAKQDSIAAAKAREEAARNTTTTTKDGVEVEQFDDNNPYNYVVAGSFGSLSNALKLKSQLEAKGYDVTILEHKARGFFRVTLYKSTDSLEADNYKVKARTDLNNPSIWVLEGQKYEKDAQKLEQKEQAEEQEAKQQPVIKRTVEINTEEQNGVKLEVLDANNRFYHVIAGSFGSLDNAVKLMDTYKAQGYDAKILLDKDRGLYRVALFSSLDAAEARKELFKLQEAIDPSLWLLRK